MSLLQSPSRTPICDLIMMSWGFGRIDALCCTQFSLLTLSHGMLLGAQANRTHHTKRALFHAHQKTLHNLVDKCAYAFAELADHRQVRLHV
jgi:hypothetical protein